MFLGEYHRTIDNKGRIFIPSKFREDLIQGVIICRGFYEKCLFLFSRDSWKAFESRIRALPMSKQDARDFSRLIFPSSVEGEMDQQGRIKIPQTLMDYADIKKDVVLIGVSDRAEIWAKENWTSYYEQINSRFSKERGALEQLGF
ncbi:MAG: division/cell wall cluster transcriptional repressor MraZ [Actinobacteria bacterium]|nr:division/cell wall cluster transcriptional repressor MraZ [Actinomycetota bacterium]